jgi:hypothetical protein
MSAAGEGSEAGRVSETSASNVSRDAAARPKRPRGPRKSTVAALEAAREAGITEGMTRARQLPSGIWLWLSLSFVAGAALHAWLP